MRATARDFDPTVDQARHNPFVLSPHDFADSDPEGYTNHLQRKPWRVRQTVESPPFLGVGVVPVLVAAVIVLLYSKMLG